MSGPYQNADLNALLDKINAYSALPPPPDDQGARDRSLIIGKLVMMLMSQGGSRP
jgi:hypothetical protein